MNLLSGMTQIHQLSAFRKRSFERFYQFQTRFRVLPLFADVSLIITFIGTLLFLLALWLDPAGPGINGAHLLYTAILAGLIGLHRLTIVRRASPLIVYLMFLHIALFGYLAYMVAGATVVALVGPYFFLSSVGLITLSLRHTMIILTINLCLLMIATALVVPGKDFGSTLFGVLFNWIILMCLVVAPLSAYFFRLFLRNLLALQFLLKDRNRVLSQTLRALERTEDRLAQEQKHQALSLMAKGLLHEIMNPLNCASQAVDYAAAVNNDPELTEALDDAAVHQKRIADIVSDLIDFSRPAPDHSLEQADVRSLADTAVRFCQSQLSDIDVQIAIPFNTNIVCYPSALVQVFVNLLMNSASAITRHERQSQGRIDIGAHQQGDLMAITIRDNGRGIPQADIQRLTDPFYSTNNAPDNLGLGLSICQTIMRHHHGRMAIQSVPGEWTEITLTLPLSPT
ncbi:HAMP domain-containing sensor histidine kinase [Allohahella marinimesophila]|uniref:histidine kinase n=1 Tax=Allohahella marinimesophila TaxID=1054972 RepID=A0ABP7NG24_9GAMM